MKHFYFILLILLSSLSISAKTYFVAVEGSDSNRGTIDAPFATLNKVQSLVQAGDTVYFRGGTYLISEDQIMDKTSSNIRDYVFKMSKSGSKQKPICYFGYPGERPVFNMENVKPADRRIVVFYINASYLHFKNFEIIGTQVTITTHTQSECFRHEGGDDNIYENLAMHDGMAIGFYLVRGSNNLILNCDAYNNYDPVSENGKGGNVDGFGGHTNKTSYTGNVFRGCRAWYNSDDGFDLISAYSAFTIENCWSFFNGYKPNSKDSAGDGSGFKAGGFGMSVSADAPEGNIPMHIVQNCLAYYNKNQGFYANHHLGGIVWYNNTGYKNPSNYCMKNRKSLAETVDVSGYGHIIKNNLSYGPRSSGKHIIDVDQNLCEISNNSFLPNMSLSDNDFISLDETELMKPRKEDGSLPDINFLRPKAASRLIDAGVNVGLPFHGYKPDIGCFEYISGSGIDLTALDTAENNVWIANNTLYIEANEDCALRIINQQGVCVKEKKMSKGVHSFNQNKGFYILLIGGELRKIVL